MQPLGWIVGPAALGVAGLLHWCPTRERACAALRPALRAAARAAPAAGRGRNARRPAARAARGRHETCGEGFHFTIVDQLIRIALYDQPRAVRAPDLRVVAPGHRRRNADQAPWRGDGRGAQRDQRTERKARERDRGLGPAAACPRDHRQRIVGLAPALVVAALARPDTPVVESHARVPGFLERTRHRMDDLVLHRAAMLRVGMADHGTAAQRFEPRGIDDRLQPARRTVDDGWLRRQAAARTQGFLPPAKSSDAELMQ